MGQYVPIVLLMALGALYSSRRIWLLISVVNNLALLLFFSAFADIWLSPITYILIGLVVSLRRYVSRRRVVVV